MEIRITCRNCEHSPELDRHIQGQLAKITEFLAKERLPQIIEFVVEMHPKHAHHRISARLKAADHLCVAEQEGPDLYAQINEVCDRIYEQLRKRKRELVDERNHGCGGECRAEFYEELEDIEEEVDELDDEE